MGGPKRGVPKDQKDSLAQTFMRFKRNRPEDQDAQTRNGFDQGPIEETEGDVAMKGRRMEVVRGSGDVFHDLGHENADVEQFKAILSAEIIKLLDRENLSVRGAEGRTGIAAADFSRIRNAELGRFTVDRLMSIINWLGSRVDVKVRIRRAQPGNQERLRSEIRESVKCCAEADRRENRLLAPGGVTCYE